MKPRFFLRFLSELACFNPVFACFTCFSSLLVVKSVTFLTIIDGNDNIRPEYGPVCEDLKNCQKETERAESVAKVSYEQF